MKYDIQAIKLRVHCADVLRQHGIEWSGKKICCPFSDHNDTNPSFGLIDDDKAFNCFGCGRKGDVIDLQS